MKTTLKQCARFVVDDARDRPWFLALETVSTLLGMIGALHLAMYNTDSNFILVWCAYGLSAIGLAIIGYLRQSTNIMVLMLFYTAINLIGLYNTIT